MKKDKKTIYGWQKEAEEYFSNTPHPKLWFEFLGWITLLSSLNFLSEKTGLFYIQAIYYFSFLVLYNHIQKTLWTRKFQEYLPSKLNEKARKWITYLVSVISVVLAYLFVYEIVRDLTATLKF